MRKTSNNNVQATSQKRKIKPEKLKRVSYISQLVDYMDIVASASLGGALSGVGHADSVSAATFPPVNKNDSMFEPLQSVSVESASGIFETTKQGPLRENDKSIHSVNHLNMKRYDLVSEDEARRDAKNAYNLGIIFTMKGDYDRAYNSYSIALKATQAIRRAENSRLVNLKVASIKEKMGDLSMQLKHDRDALQHYDAALYILLRQADGEESEAVAEIQLKKADIFLNREENEKALECFTSALPGTKDLYLTVGKDVRTEVLIKMGYLFYKLNDCESAFSSFSEALTKESNAHDFASICYTMGLMCEKLGKPDLATSHFSRALSIMKDPLSFDFGREDHKHLAAVLRRLGSLHFQQGQYSDALRSCSDAFQILRKKNDIQGMLTVSKNMALIYLQTKQLDKAIGCYEEQLVLVKDTQGEDHESLAMIYHDLGCIYDKMGRSKQHNTIECYEQELKIRRNNSNVWDRGRVAKLLRCHARMCCEIGDYDASLRYFSMAIDYSISVALNESDDHPEFTENNVYSAIVFNRWTHYENYFASKEVIPENTDAPMFSTPNYIADMMNNMGNVFFRRKSYREAICCYEGSLRIMEKKTNHVNDEEVLSIKLNLGITFSKMASTILETTMLPRSSLYLQETKKTGLELKAIQTSLITNKSVLNESNHCSQEYEKTMDKIGAKQDKLATDEMLPSVIHQPYQEPGKTKEKNNVILQNFFRMMHGNANEPRKKH